MTLKKGDPWPFPQRRGLTGDKLDEPKWFGLVVAPQKEARTADKLEQVDVEVSYPTEEIIRHRNGKRIETQKPMVSRVIYAKFTHAPQWDVLKERRIITGVFCSGNYPVSINPDTIRAIMGLPLEEERLERERIEAITPEVGENVQLIGGLFDGFRVDVIRSEHGRVWYKGITELGAMRGSTSVDGILRRVAI